MRSIKPGRGPSALSAAGSAIAILFGIFWTVMAFSITRNSPLPIAGVIFPLFGIVFVLFGIIQLVYNLKNTVSEDRFSLMDITEAGTEIDPFEKRFGNPKHADDTSIESRLKKLDDLRDSGLITPSEHAAKRKALIDEI
jgi:hypothetical protein